MKLVVIGFLLALILSPTSLVRADEAPALVGGDGRDFAPPDASTLAILRGDEEKLDLYCLKRSYPGIEGIATRSDGSKWLTTRDGRSILYKRANPAKSGGFDSDSTTVAESMGTVYPLEPERPDLPPGFSPGRKRSKALMAWLYGDDREAVSKGLKTAALRGKRVSMSPAPIAALKRAIPELERLALANPGLKVYLEPAGGFNWRKIAGENRLSPHSYGVALDVGVSVSPYWRWAKINPHPKQKTYPPEIVAVFEKNGFIWGGKWREYDLMHFEYRPELICKAGIKKLF